MPLAGIRGGRTAPAKKRVETALICRELADRMMAAAGRSDKNSVVFQRKSAASERMLRVGVFWRPDGFSPTATSWPLAKMTYGPDGATVKALGSSRTFVWDEVAAAQRTASGVRLQFGDRSKTIVLGSVGSGRTQLVRAVRAHVPADRFDETVHRLTTRCWDPDQ